MSLPSAWIDRIFSKLTVTYGREFLDRWVGLDLQVVKDDWAGELSGYQANPAAIGHALTVLPMGRPPTVQDFKALCRGAPRAADLALPAPLLPAGELKVRMDAAAKAVTRTPAGSGKQWAHDLQGRIDRREIKPTLYQKKCIADALGVES